jgi:hypothetical protein
MYAGFGWENLKERDHLKDLGAERRVHEKGLKETDESVWADFIWLRVVAAG